MSVFESANKPLAGSQTKNLLQKALVYSRTLRDNIISNEHYERLRIIALTVSINAFSKKLAPSI